ncbi:MAG: glycoside hydrolase family 92 protein [Deltaproteobacteria bacterium]|nr:glycoside hydrolase family 92 protein [Deltaproteobacteria bacterium]
MHRTRRLWAWMLVVVIAVTLSSFACDSDDDDDEAATDEDLDGDDDCKDEVVEYPDYCVDIESDDDDDTDGDDDMICKDDASETDAFLAIVNPFIGTDGFAWGIGSMSPGPLTPFGLVKLGPDTQYENFYLGFIHYAGYRYAENFIRGFSHTHMPSTGITDGGHVNLMPVLGMDDAKVTLDGYKAPFSHDDESASPGYYQVRLQDSRINVELTASPLVGYHRYTFPADGDAPYVVVDAGYALNRNAAKDTEITIDPEAREITGRSMQQGGFSRSYGGVTIYFAAKFDTDFADYGTFADGVRSPGATTTTGKAAGAYAGFAPGTQTAGARVAVSFISVEQARANLAADAFDDFDEALDNARTLWSDFLRQVTIEGGTPEERRIFRTAQFHLGVLPTLMTEAGGLYRGFDGEVHEATDFTYYSDLSLWDTFRTFHPLMALIDPARNLDFIKSGVAMWEQGGAFPKWSGWLGETDVMIGTHYDTVVADAYLKGNAGVNNELMRKIWPGLVEHATEFTEPAGRPGIEDYINLGYVPHDKFDQSVSRTQEYALNDYCLARLGYEIGEDEIADILYERSANYKNLWDEQTRYFRPRNADGSWLDPFDPGKGQEIYSFLTATGYTEGNARHWRWMVMHDPDALIDLFDSDGQFVEQLNEFMELGIPDSPDLLLDPYYWHGNEPDMHAPYLFAFAGRHDLTAEWVRWVMENHYNTGPLGLDGNDDGGTLSAWYIFSALGFFPLPCTDMYVIGSPIFDYAEIPMGECRLAVQVENAGSENVYVESVRINGTTLTEPYFTHDMIANGGVIEFVMSPTPTAFGTITDEDRIE